MGVGVINIFGHLSGCVCGGGGVEKISGETGGGVNKNFGDSTKKMYPTPCPHSTNTPDNK